MPAIAQHPQFIVERYAGSSPARDAPFKSSTALVGGDIENEYDLRASVSKVLHSFQTNKAFLQNPYQKKHKAPLNAIKEHP